MQRKLMVLFTVLVLLGLILTFAGGVQAQEGDPLQRKRPGTGFLTEPLAPPENPLPASGVTNFVADPSFEASFPYGPPWYSTSMNFPSVLCTKAACGTGSGTAGPHTGNVWVWLGGIAPQNESGSAYQAVSFPSCGATLQFYLWIGAATKGSDANDRLIVQIDNTQVFTANATQKSLYPSYKLVSVNVNAFADGSQHTVRFWGITTNQLVTFNIDDVSLTSGPCVTISGSTGMGSVVINYYNVRPQGFQTQADGSYSFKVPLHWSGKVTPFYPDRIFSPASRTYTNLLVNQVGQNYTPQYVISGNTNTAGVTLSYLDVNPKTATSAANGDYSLPVRTGWSGTVTPSHTCFTFNPASRSYSDVIHSIALQDYTATVVSGCADITAVVAFDQFRYGVPSQGSTRASFAGLNGGPVRIESGNNVPIIGAERLIYKVNNVNTSFAELMGLPNSQLDTTYWLPWYNNVDLDTQLRFAVINHDATVHILIGGVEMPGSPFTIQPNESTRKSFPGVNGGPVQIVSDFNIVASERLIYKDAGNVAVSFAEMMALPNSQLDTVYWLPWYNNVELDTQLRLANVSGSTATVHITIGGVEMTGSPFTLAAGASARKSFPGINAGPVKIESDQNIVVSERVIYKVNNVNTSFSEMMGLPDSQLNTTYWLPWYNNVDIDTQLRFANVSTSTASVHVLIGGVEMTGSPFTLGAGASTRKSFVGINSGPVQIVSDFNVVASERVIYKVNNVNTSFSEMMGLPDALLDPIYWMPWYNNVDMDTQLRFGVP